jgi:hypothetical protein
MNHPCGPVVVGVLEHVATCLLSVCHEIIPTPDRLILDQFDPSEHDGDGPERQKSNAGAVRWLRIRACHNNPFNG